jgi:ADP-ribosyl-[dinitrogen reductase] hydrolase
MEKFIEDEVRLIHPHENIVRSSVQWTKTLYLLSIRKDNNELDKAFKGSLSEANKKINKDWVAEIDAEIEMPAKTHQGWAKIAWTYGMRELKKAVEIYKQNKSYKFDDFYYQEVIERVLARGGDTDTNAAIVGGMVGAIVGFKNLPGDYLRKMMELDFSKKENRMRNDRNRFYEPRSAFVTIYQFL